MRRFLLLAFVLIGFNVYAQCTDPSNLSAITITQTTASLQWVENGTATLWEVEIVLAGNAPTGAGLTGPNPYNAVNLQSGTDYEFYVRSNCGASGLSNWVGPFAFTTVACDFTITSSSDPASCLGYTFTPSGNIFGTNFDFNSGTLPTGWAASPFTVGTPCTTDMVDNTPYFWATTLNALGERDVTTNSLDVSFGGTIEFYMRYGADDPDPGCEDPDLANEGVFLQYSINGGGTWVTINTWNPTGILTNPLYSWNQYVENIPPGAQTANTLFRWYQPDNSGTQYDNWGLDNIVISANTVAINYQWDIDGSIYTTQNPTHTFPGPGDYDVSLTINSPTCNATTVQTFTVADTTAPVAACQDITINLDVLGQATITPADIENGSTDNCAVVGYSLSQTTFDCSNFGANNVVLTVTDAAGNSDTCNATVTVTANRDPGLDSSEAFCEGDSALKDLFGMITGTPEVGGSWIDLDGAGVDLTDPSQVDFSTVNSGVFNFQYVFYNGMACPDVSSNLEITIIDLPSPGTDGTLDFCEFDDTLQDLFDALDGTPEVGGVWTDLDGTGVDLTVPTHVDFSSINDGVYQFEYAFPPQGTCPGSSAIVEVTINNAPFANTPPFSEYCDDDNDGFGVFDLNSLIDVISGGNPNLQVNFYETDAQRDLGVSPIPTNADYQNILPYSQILYISVEDANTSCINTFTEIELIVIDSPILASTVIPFEFCDYYDIITDGINLFDLTALEPELIALELAANPTNTIADYTFHYYNTLIGAQTEDPADLINAPHLYEGGSQSVFVNVFNTTVNSGVVITNCFSTAELVLTVNLPPITQPAEIVKCDDEYFPNIPPVPDNYFDLTEFETLITNQTGLTFSYFLDPNDAANNVVANALENQPGIDITNFLNTLNPQDIFIRVENDAGCFVVESCKISVNNNPSPLSTDELAALLPNGVFESCLNDGNGPGTLQDGYALFDLTTFTADIFNGESYVSATYYESAENANLQINQIQNPTQYYNSVPYGQTIWIVVTNTGDPANNVTATGCYTILEMEIHVPVPQVTLEALNGNTVLCVDENGVPLANNDLPVLIANAHSLLGNLPTSQYLYNTSDYMYTWSLDGVAIPGASSNTLTVSQPGDYMVTVSGPVNALCENFASETITVSASPATFDAVVTTNAFDSNHQILASASSTISGVEFEYSLDDEMGPYQSSGEFNDVTPGPHTVYIRDVLGCKTLSVNVFVVDYPKFFSPNNDNVNDFWMIYGINGDENGGGIPISQIYIFDRYGKLLKQLDPDSRGWDGTYNGNQMPSSDYWFKIIYIEDNVQKEFKAHFSLKR